MVAGIAQSAVLSERLEAVHFGFLDERRASLAGLSDPFGVPRAARVVIERPSGTLHGGHPWKRGIVATIFWFGEPPLPQR
jgi:hypothetical protein